MDTYGEIQSFVKFQIDLFFLVLFKEMRTRGESNILSFLCLMLVFNLLWVVFVDY